MANETGIFGRWKRLCGIFGLGRKREFKTSEKQIMNKTEEYPIFAEQWMDEFQNSWDSFTHRIYAQDFFLLYCWFILNYIFFVVEVQTLNVLCAETIQKTTHYE